MYMYIYEVSRTCLGYGLRPGKVDLVEKLSDRENLEKVL